MQTLITCNATTTARLVKRQPLSPTPVGSLDVTSRLDHGGLQACSRKIRGQSNQDTGCCVRFANESAMLECSQHGVRVGFAGWKTELLFRHCGVVTAGAAERIPSAPAEAMFGLERGEASSWSNRHE
ncbi:MAG: hypothetical protein WBE26_19790 [Phycisphaerae bacterium]|jgi:hypothetical protein